MFPVINPLFFVVWIIVLACCMTGEHTEPGVYLQELVRLWGPSLPPTCALITSQTPGRGLMIVLEKTNPNACHAGCGLEMSECLVSLYEVSETLAHFFHAGVKLV
jgi:hypothetical protein